MLKSTFQRLIIFGLFTFSISNQSAIANNSIDKSSKLWTKFNQASTPSYKIKALSKIANYAFQSQSDLHLADSVSKVAIELAEDTYDDDLIRESYNYYLENNELNAFKSKAESIVDKLLNSLKLTNDPEIIWRSYLNIAKFYIENYQYNEALEYCYDAFIIAGNLEDEYFKSKSYLSLGEALEANDQKIEAFRNYLSALTIAETTKNDILLIECYNRLSRFYQLNDIHDKSRFYKFKQFEKITKQTPLDSLELMNVLLDFEMISYDANNSINKRIIDNVYDFSVKNNEIVLKNDVSSLYRSHLINAHNLKELHEYYIIERPEELIALSENNYTLYLRIKAFLNEYENKIDSSSYYFEEAEKLMALSTNKLMYSHFLYRYGEYLERVDNPKNALSKYVKSLLMSTEARYIPFSLKSAKKLESLHAKLENYEQAYKYAHINQVLSDSLNTIAKQDELFELELENQQQLRQLALEREEAQTKRRHNLQYTAIAILVFTAFVVLIMLGRFNVPRWAIQSIGFFAFIFAFEFIILIADHKIHHLTHGEPWKILLIKIFLIGILLPLHHYLEGKAVSFVLHNKRFNLKNTSFSFKEFFTKYILKEGEH